MRDFVGSSGICVDCLTAKSGPRRAPRELRRAYLAARSAHRRARKIRATPAWVDKAELDEIYQRCEQVTRNTGVKHHVDHIVPLQGEFVSGLHVPWNLQVIPAIDNIRKGNKFSLEGATASEV